MSLIAWKKEKQKNIYYHYTALISFVVLIAFTKLIDLTAVKPTALPAGCLVTREGVRFQCPGASLHTAPSAAPGPAHLLGTQLSHADCQITRKPAWPRENESCLSSPEVILPGKPLFCHLWILVCCENKDHRPQ